MFNVFESATKIVLLILTIGATALTFLGVLDSKDFFQGWMLVLAFYFGQKKNVPSKEEIELEKLKNNNG